MSKGKANGEAPSKEDELVYDNIDSGSEDDFNVLCNVVFVLPREYDCVTELFESADCEEEEMPRHKLVCYFIMNNGFIEEQNVFFERPGEGIKNHLKPFFIRVKVKDTTVNKILVDGGDVISLDPIFC